MLFGVVQNIDKLLYIAKKAEIWTINRPARHMNEVESMRVALFPVAAIAYVSRAELSNETAKELSILADAVRKEFNLTEPSEDNPVAETEEITVVADSIEAAPAPIYARQTNDGLALKIMQVPDIHYYSVPH
ncbi:hypothetical protein AC1031_021034 [Aphanomyces cochlioides]|nr:hypothetical protein AC1031_021034 [Aphanomyces cochlioides]